MSLITDAKYVLMASVRLRNFVQKREYLYQFDCPLCGDNPGKRGRGANIFRSSRADNLMYHCYRCNQSLSLRDLLGKVDVDLAEQYRKEIRTPWFYRYTQPVKIEQPQAPVYQPCPSAILDDLRSIETLPDNHPAKVYIMNRKIPASFHKSLYWAEDFAALAQKFRPDGTYNKLVSEPRIVIPSLDENGNILALQGRSINPECPVKYITAKTADAAPKLFGLHRHQKHERTYVTEGPFDAMFLPNALSIGGSDLACPQVPKDAVMVFDNEPRRPQTVMKMLKAAEDGFAVCVWPEYLQQKDINDMILNGRSPEHVKQLIDECTCQGRTAIRRINFWKRVNIQTRKV
jgi:hypothetical protein